jgi:hypothetical protein
VIHASSLGFDAALDEWRCVRQSCWLEIHLR